MGNVREGDTKTEALERLGQGPGGLFDKDNLSLLLDSDRLTRARGPYVFRPRLLSSPWDQLTDVTYKSWLLEAMTVEEYNASTPRDRQLLLSDFEQQQQRQKMPLLLLSSMASSFDSASRKLLKGTPPFPLADLPASLNDSLWADLRNEYGLSLAELSSLKNHVSEQQQQQQESPDPGYPFIGSIYILYSKPSGNEISVIATAFAVTNTLACTAGHTVSEKNNQNSQALVIAEDLFLTSILVRNDGTIAPEEGKEEIPVSVHKCHYENDWAVLKRKDQGFFPQFIPVAKSADEVPREGARNELTFYHCPVTLFNVDEEFTDRLHVTPKSGSVGLIKKNSIDFQNGGFDGSCGGPYVYMGKAIAIHTLSQNSALTSETLRIHQIQQGERSVSNKRMKVADLTIVADSVAASHTSVGTGILIHKRAGLLQCINE